MYTSYISDVNVKPDLRLRNSKAIVCLRKKTTAQLLLLDGSRKTTHTCSYWISSARDADSNSSAGNRRNNIEMFKTTTFTPRLGLLWLEIGSRTLIPGSLNSQNRSFRYIRKRSIKTDLPALLSFQCEMYPSLSITFHLGCSETEKEENIHLFLFCQFKFARAPLFPNENLFFFFAAPNFAKVVCSRDNDDWPRFGLTYLLTL